MTAFSQNLSLPLRPTLCRAFTLALLLHAFAGGLLLVGVRYWPVARLRPPPAGLVLEIAEPLPVQEPVEASTVLDQALAVIPPESRSAPLPELPEARALALPEPGIKGPDQMAVWVPTLPTLPALAGGRPAAVATGAWDKAPAPSPVGKTQGGRPTALSGIQPHYPYGARLRGEAGRVTVQVRVNEKGEVETVTVVAGSGYPALDDSAVAAAKKARFKPAEQGGRPVASEMNLQFEFRLEER